MAVFNKKDTLIKTICFMAFFVAINIICALLSVYLPLLSIIFIIILPLGSALVEINCKDRWFPIYAFATIGLSIVVTLSSIDFTIFYIVPSIATGYIFGLFCKKKLPDMFAIFFASIVQAGLSFLFIPLIKLITGSDLIEVFVKIFKISDTFLFNNVLILLFFMVALIQIILSYIVVDAELQKLGQKEETKKDYTLFADISILASALLATIFSFFSLPAAYLFVGICWYFAAFVVFYQSKSAYKYCLIIDGVMLLIGMFLYAALNKYLNEGVDYVLFGITPLLISIFSISYSFLKKSRQ